MLYFEFGQDRLAEAHAPRAFELAHCTIEAASRLAPQPLTNHAY